MRIAALLCILIVVGCSSPPPTTTRYLLRADVAMGTERLEPPLWIALRRVEVAPYLAEPGLVIELRDREVRPARYHVWAEPLADGVRRYLGQEISNELGHAIARDAAQRLQWDRTVDIRIDRLHGTLAGDAMIEARWSVAPAERQAEIAVFRFAASAPLPREGYEGLVDAEVILLDQLAQAVADSLR
jgi:uncharacterized lipoprotein YmbA